MSLLWKKIIRPIAFGLEAERAHEIGIKALKSGLATPFYCDDDFGFGEIERFGLKFVNPLGMAAGFDKNGVVVNQLASLGFGFVEVGTVTLRPQKGNPKPRLFRLPQDQALINRLGFNNDGAEVVAERLSKLKRRCIVGVNIGKNKDVPNEEAVENYLSCFEVVHPVAGYVAINISSPNTPNLRELQAAKYLEMLLAAITGRNAGVNERACDAGSTLLNSRVSARSIPILVKIAPDLTNVEIESVIDVCISHKVDGVIATNTTISRDGLKTQGVDQFGAGGLSGKPLTARSNEVVSTIYRYSKGKLPIIGVGGIFSAEDAFAKIAAGASLLQAYTGFVYAGPTFASEVNRGLGEILKSRGFASVDEAVGSNV